MAFGKRRLIFQATAPNPAKVVVGPCVDLEWGARSGASTQVPRKRTFDCRLNTYSIPLRLAYLL